MTIPPANAVTVTFQQWQAGILAGLQARGIDCGPASIPYGKWRTWFVACNSIETDVGNAATFLANAAGEADRRRERMNANRSM